MSCRLPYTFWCFLTSEAISVFHKLEIKVNDKRLMYKRLKVRKRVGIFSAL